MLRLLTAFLLFLFPASVFAGDAPPEGDWKVTAGVRLSDDGAVAEADKSDEYLGTTIRFSATAVDGPSPFGCRAARFAWSDMPAEGFFQGFAATTEKAAANARILRLPDPARTLDVTCETGIFDFHMRDDDTMLIMLDLVVYTFERQK